MNYIRNMKIPSKIIALSKQSEEMYNEQLQSISILGKIKASNRLIDSLTFQIMAEQSEETKNQLIQFQNEEVVQILTY